MLNIEDELMFQEWTTYLDSLKSFDTSPMGEEAPHPVVNHEFIPKLEDDWLEYPPILSRVPLKLQELKEKCMIVQHIVVLITFNWIATDEVIEEPSSLQEQSLQEEDPQSTNPLPITLKERAQKIARFKAKKKTWNRILFPLRQSKAALRIRRNGKFLSSKVSHNFEKLCLSHQDLCFRRSMT